MKKNLVALVVLLSVLLSSISFQVNAGDIGQDTSETTKNSALPKGFVIDDYGFILNRKKERICVSEAVNYFSPEMTQQLTASKRKCKLWDGSFAEPEPQMNTLKQ